MGRIKFWTLSGNPAAIYGTRSRFALFLLFLACGLWPMASNLYSQTELGSEDDITVLGADGTAVDPDAEIKGFTVFGSTQAAYTGAVVGPGNVVVNGVLAVSSGAYFVGNSTFTFANKIFINDGSAGEILKKNSAGYLDWGTEAIGAGDNLGSHVATTTLNMAAFNIVGVSTISVSSITTAGAGVIFSTNAYFMNGNVGIGTAAPETLLHVGGTAKVTSLVVVDGLGKIRGSTTGNGVGLDFSGDTVSFGFGAGSMVRWIGGNPGSLDLQNYNTPIVMGAGNTAVIKWSSDTGLFRNAAGVVEINNGTAGTYRDIQLRAINPTTGNVGIGEVAPGSKLAVSGGATIGATYDTTAAPTNGMIIEGNVGIGTATPGATGWTKLEISGTDSSNVGPHMQFTTSLDAHPLIQILPYAHDNIYTIFDGYFNGAFRSSDAGSNFGLLKETDKFSLIYSSGVAAGSVISWNKGLTMDTSGRIGIGTVTPTQNLQVGSIGSVSTANTNKISLGGTFSPTPGANLKLLVYDDSASILGFGVSSNGGLAQLDYGLNSSAFDHVFYGTTNELMRIKGTGKISMGGLTSPLNTLHVFGGGTAISNAGSSPAGSVIVEGANVALPTDGAVNLNIISNSAMAIDTGGTLSFGGKYDGDSWAQFARIKGAKEDGTGANQNGYLAFGVRGASGSTLEGMRITSVGNVGIGTAGPGAKLHVSGGDANTASFKVEGSSYVILNAGNVGIGTAAPETLLHVGGTAKVTSLVVVDGLGKIRGSTTGNGVGLDFSGDTVSFGFGAGSMVRWIGGNPGSLDLQNYNTPIVMGAGNTAVIKWSSDTGLFRNAAGVVEINNGTAGTYRDIQLRAINPTTGNVGIGTTGPAYRLVVSSGAGEAGTILAVSTGTSTMIELQGDGEIIAKKFTGDGSGLTGISATDGTKVAKAGDTMVGQLTLSGSTLTVIAPTSAASSLWVSTSVTTPHLYISTAGNVGIGTTAPTSELTVKGNSDTLTLFGETATNPDTSIIFRLRGTTAGQYGQPDTTGSSAGRILSIADGGGFADSRITIGTASGADTYLDTLTLKNGNVGIGTTAPGYKLDVITTDPTQFRVGYSATNYVAISHQSASAGAIINAVGDSESNKFLAFQLGGLEKMRIVQTSGNVGIGTTAPGAKLHVNGGDATTASFKVEGSSYVILNAGNVGIGTTTPGAKLEVKQAATDSYAVKVSSNDGTAMMVVNNQGNVGIGTTAPGYKLDVITTDPTQFRVGYSATNYVAISHQSASAGAIINAVGDSESNKFLAFQLGGLEKMRIVQTSGNVGIGTASPGAKLDVAGNINATQWITGGCVNPADANDIMVAVGPWCVDKYEASVWSTATGGTQYGSASDNYPCNDNGQDCGVGAANPIYARSVSGVAPSVSLTWFQANMACFNAGKELLPNAVWQAAASGTTDPGATGSGVNCNVSGGAKENTGGATGCVSTWGAEDMIGNVWEWVAEWGTASAGASAAYGTSVEVDGTGTGYNNDGQWNIGGNSYTNYAAPAAWIQGQIPAVLRGGSWGNGANAGVFAFAAGNAPSNWLATLGFRCGRRR